MVKSTPKSTKLANAPRPAKTKSPTITDAERKKATADAERKKAINEEKRRVRMMRRGRR